jgi:hypothetical protein
MSGLIGKTPGSYRIISQIGAGGSGYSMPLAITLINPTTESQKTFNYVQAQNPLFTQASANSQGYGYQTYGSPMLDPGYIDANGNLIVRVA